MVDCKSIQEFENVYLLTNIVAMNSLSGDKNGALSARKHLENCISVGSPSLDSAMNNFDPDVNKDDYDKEGEDELQESDSDIIKWIQQNK